MLFNTSYPHIITDDSLMETASHGSIEYPFQFYDENMEQFDFNCVDWHWHTELEFVLVESDYAKEYRIKKAEQQKRWYEKKKASRPPKEKKPPMTKEERSRKVCAYQKEYYAAHPDKLAERREKNRIAEKARRERKKAERLAAQQA